MYNIQRSGDLFRVGNDEVGYKTFRLKVKKGGQEVHLSSEVVDEIAEKIFAILKGSQISFMSLANTCVTELGIQTDQQESGKPYLAKKETLEEFDIFYKEVTKIAAEAIKSHLQDMEKEPEKIKGATKEKGNIPFLDTAIKEAGQVFDKRKVPSFLMKIYEMFEKVLSPKSFYKRHEEYAKSLITKSPAKIEALQEFSLVDAINSPESAKFGEVGSKFVYVPSAFLKTEEEAEAEVRDNSITSDVAVTSGYKLYKEVPNFYSDGIEITGYKIHDGGEAVTQGQVTPTAFVKAKKKEDKRDRLVNIYMTTDESGLLRTGVVNSPEKAAAFLTAARKVNEFTGGPPRERPVRVISEQLNSPESERKMITNQHMQLGALDHVTEDVEIAHIVTPTNRLYEHQRTLEKKGIRLLKGEYESRHQNIEGMARYLIWLVDDLKYDSQNPDLPPEQRQAFKLATLALERGQKQEMQKMKASIAEISACNAELAALDQQIQVKNKERGELSIFERGAIDQEIKELENESAKLLQTIEEIRGKLVNEGAGEMGTLQKVYSILYDEVEQGFLAGDEFVGARDVIMLYRKLLGNHYMRSSVDKGELMERGQELMMFQLLNDKLGVIGALNCKSGLDRTGIAFAIALALKNFDEEEKLELVLHWDESTKELNQKMRELDYDTVALYKWLDAPGDKEKKMALRTALEFRLQVTQHLLKVCLPITAISTGVIGLKWSKGLSENLIPLNFIPPVIQIVDNEGKIEEARIITYGKSGRPEGLTEVGHRFLTQLSPRRGA